jgi:hypothetical protein
MRILKKMFKFILLPILFIGTVTYAAFAGTMGKEIVDNYIIKSENQTIVFLNSKNAGNYLLKSPVYEHWNDYFDASIRLEKDLSNQSKEENKKTYDLFLRKQCLNWGENEIKKITEILSTSQVKIKKISSNILKDTVYIIKTTGKEEFDAYYTNQGAIIIPKKELKFLYFNARKTEVESTLIHEYLHIYTRNNIAKREELYAIIGFKKVNPFVIPIEIDKIRITNPDNYELNYVISLPNKKNEMTNYTMLLTSKYLKYEGTKGFIGFFSTLFGYLDESIYSVNEKGEVSPNKVEIPKTVFEKTGNISSYNYGPDEIIAEAFKILVSTKWQDNKQLTQRDKEILTKIHEAIK